MAVFTRVLRNGLFWGYWEGFPMEKVWTCRNM